ncbi:uncharacterized protein MELLADRAFT_88075 [Melampsora larici-populina 98AG31]|uniref:CNH domain-containing protein n=1 Tax=Melampsora larici-populina (strain 98AG31 / pathotype 3-4-7) TaxID=747676 RepID=F4RQC4_MELLP|nr:uncharacterized protein MELLADRAFT_88075 [Melampsora larici-populina 98AG31]EGG05431.1 hypothetical protein MELLADRAFT_88075 [Melampsora larici-populina 98AG31]
MATTSKSTDSIYQLRTLIKPVFSIQSASSTASSSKSPVVKSVDGYHSFLWIGSNEGRVKGFDIKPAKQINQSNPSSPINRLESQSISPTTSTSLSSPISSKSPTGTKHSETSDLLDGHLEANCFQDHHVFPSTETTKSKPVEKLILIPIISMAVILSEGAVSFHSINDLDPLPGFPTIRGVSAVTLDEDTFDNLPQETDITMCVIKKKTIHLYYLQESGIQQIHEVSFTSAAFNGILRRSVLLLSDIEQYYLVSLNQSVANLIPLLPISQSNNDPNQQLSSQHRPSMSAIPNSDEFLIASHTGTTCLGVFVSSTGDPCRGTLEWLSNPRSISVDETHVLALLFNGTIEIHSLETQELLQTIELPIGLEPRTLSSTKFGLSLPGKSFDSDFELIKSRFSSNQPQDLSSPTTPTIPHHRNSSYKSNEVPACQSSLLLVGRDSVHALCTKPFLTQVESLISSLRWDDALRLVESTVAKSMNENTSPYSSRSYQSTSRLGSTGHKDFMIRIYYIYQKIALHHLVETKFQEAGELWFKGKGDPRVLIELFPYLRANVVAQDDEVDVYRGLETLIKEIKSANAIIMGNLVRNYSPHIKPDVENAASTMDLKAVLLEKSKLMVLSYLRRWKRDRLLNGGASLSNRHLDTIVDTALAELLAERRGNDQDSYRELKLLLERPNTCIPEELEIILQKNQCFTLLGELYYRLNNLPKVLETWSRLHDKEWADDSFNEPLGQMVNLLQKTNQLNLVTHYAIWLAKHNWNLSIKLLTESLVSESIDIQETLEKLKEVNEEVVEVYLEHLVLRNYSARRSKKRQVAMNVDVSRLRTSLILGYLGRLKEGMKSQLIDGKPQNSAISELFRKIINRYLLETSSGSEVPNFVDYLLKVHLELVELPRADPNSLDRFGHHDPILTRLKLMVCLDPWERNGDDGYDVTSVRRALEDMGGCSEMMAFERAMAYSKLKIHRPALSLLAVTLQDLDSSERYCLRSGSLLNINQVKNILERSGLLTSTSTPHPMMMNNNDNNIEKKDENQSRELLLILLDLMINSTSTNQELDSKRQKEKSIGNLLKKYTPLLDCQDTLKSLPNQFLLKNFEDHFKRSLRFSNHLKFENQLIKFISIGQELRTLEGLKSSE